MSVVKTGNTNHDTACLLAEGVRQVAVAAATTQAAVRAADIAFHRTCLASAIANGVGHEPIRAALRSLGAGGV